MRLWKADLVDYCADLIDANDRLERRIEYLEGRNSFLEARHAAHPALKVAEGAERILRAGADAMRSVRLPPILKIERGISEAKAASIQYMTIPPRGTDE